VSVPVYQPATLTGEEIQQLLEALATDRLQALCGLALATGARLGELLGLQWAEVDWEAPAIQNRCTLVRSRNSQPVFGLRRIRFRDLRHATGSHLVASGADVAKADTLVRRLA